MHSKYVSPSSSSAVAESNKASSMERSSLMSSSLRDHSIKGCNKTMMMVKDPAQNQSCGGEDYNNVGFSWPPRCYACSFCKREFRSAQALGGHMNVHRRDRARLRQSPPLSPRHHPALNLNCSPSPNPNFSASTFNGSLVSPPSSTSLPAPPAPHLNEWVTPLSSPPTPRAVKKSKFLKTSVGLSLEIGQVSHSKEDLDLELRLGYP